MAAAAPAKVLAPEMATAKEAVLAKVAAPARTGSSV